ncbi:MAG: hypothetical protein BAJALOKI2v1_150067 [Promethearchaeota archaeon]|nr:MAG: hypothetical protein BAJALOKI2v1_150067 [Candidatus Lokiarchaeota archaeon]
MQTYNYSISSGRTKKILYVENTINTHEKCSICGKNLCPARLESWQNHILVDFKYHNGFCEHCGLFEYEPVKDAEIIFQSEQHQEIYSNELKTFH